MRNRYTLSLCSVVFTNIDLHKGTPGFDTLLRVIGLSKVRFVCSILAETLLNLSGRRAQFQRNRYLSSPVFCSISAAYTTYLDRQRRSSFRSSARALIIKGGCPIVQ